MQKSQLFELLYNWLPFFSRLLLRVHFRIQKLFRKKSELLKFKTFFSNFSDLSWWVLLFYLDLHFSKSIIQIFKKGLFWLVRVFWYSSSKIFRIPKGCSDWFYTFTLQPLWNFSGAKAEDRQCKSMHTVGHFHSVLKENVKFSEKKGVAFQTFTEGANLAFVFHIFLTPSPSHFDCRTIWHRTIWYRTFGTRQFGTKIIEQTIWHEDNKSGQFGTKIIKVDNLAPGQFGTRTIWHRTIWHQDNLAPNIWYD